MEQIIKSILDTDLYKLTMQNFVLQHYPDAEVVYEFKNRDKSMKFTDKAVIEINNQIKLMANLKLKVKEREWLTANAPFLPPTYIDYLSNFKFDPYTVYAYLDDDELKLRVKGKARDMILWEVHLMAIISEVYFKTVDIFWGMDDQDKIAEEKARNLSHAGCKFADFGTRRRRNYETQDIVVSKMKDFPGFVGTSNPHFAMKYGVKPIGTCAHEAIGAVAALFSLNHPNKVFMEKWTETYHGNLGIMLPDTFGIDTFFKDFDTQKAKLWDGLRHDSGDPFEFVDKVREHYLSLGIDPKEKTIVFSDSLNVTKAIELKKYCENKIKCSFGIGTFFTNDFYCSKPLNMVIKLVEIDGVPVVKLGEGDGKGNGDAHMIEVMKYIHKNKYK